MIGRVYSPTFLALVRLVAEARMRGATRLEVSPAGYQRIRAIAADDPQSPDAGASPIHMAVIVNHDLDRYPSDALVCRAVNDHGQLIHTGPLPPGSTPCRS